MNKYASYSPERQEELLSNYLIDSWSYSKVSCFARNEKAFEKTYVYGEKERSSVSSVAGSAYHEALASYFAALKGGRPVPSLVEMTARAYEYIDGIGANDWKLTKTIPAVETAVNKAKKDATSLIEHFAGEKDIYTGRLSEVLAVEEKTAAWVTVNGVDIPLPCHGILDLVIRLDDGRIVIVDHKSKSAFTNNDELALVHGKQAVSYVILWETLHPGTPVSEVWFVENKVSANNDRGAQLRCHVMGMDTDSRRLYEALLYEPLRRMIGAVGDPDYIYTINDADNLSDKAGLYEFWTRTLISEVDAFQFIPQGKRSLIEKRQRKIKDSSVKAISPKIITAFREKAASFISYDYSNTNMTNPEKIQHALMTFGISVEVPHEIMGFSCNTYLCSVAAGTDIKALQRHNLDIAFALDVPNVRIAPELVMYGGKSYVSVEVTKRRTDTLFWEPSLLEGHRIPLGLDNFREPVVWDLDNHSTPHALVCGSTGSGKSVCLRSTLKYVKAAGIKDIIIFDPKFEFATMDTGARRYCDIEELESAMSGLVTEMNRRIKERDSRLTFIIFDEFADATQSARPSRLLEAGEKTLSENLQLLLQKGRSCGMRFMLATQRASVKIIPGDLKVNLPVQICFRVNKAVDSKVVLDEEGAQMLAGGGDGLMRSPEYMDRLTRFQGFFYAPAAANNTEGGA